jgi:hypothetical protein
VRVYVAGPYTKGEPAENVRAAIVAAEALLAAGHTPLVPHLNLLWHMVFPHSWEEWLRLDLEWITTCDAVLRLPGESKGADMEVAHAGTLGIPVYYDASALLHDSELPADPMQRRSTR